MEIHIEEKQYPNQRFAPIGLSYPFGPGTMLSSMLESVGIKASPNCGCKRKALVMNLNGYEWCEGNVEKITDWLEEEAKKRNLPFLRAAGKLLIKRSIYMSKRAINKNQ